MAEFFRLTPSNRQEWLELRAKVGIGASEAAAVVGRSPWMLPVDLWKTKAGMVAKKEIKGNAAVDRGHAFEPCLRDAYAALNPETKVEYHEYDMLYRSDRPWCFATLDGELTTSDGKRGVLEIKTSEPIGKAGWAAWQNKIPDHYYLQICHQLSCSGFDFVVLVAALFDREGDYTVRHYEYDRSDLQSDMEWLEQNEDKFWDSVVNRKIPQTRIAF